MRIGLLTTSYPRRPGDLAGRFVAELAGWLADAGQQVELLAPAPACTTEHPGVTVRPLRYALRPRLLAGDGAPETLRRPLAALQAPAFVARLAAACLRRRRCWTHLMSHWLLPCSVVGAATCPALPHLAVAHSGDVHLLASLPREAGARALDALARPRTGLVLTSRSLAPRLDPLARSAAARQLLARATVTRMGVSAEQLSSGPADQARRLRGRHDLDAQLVVLFLGRLVPIKGVDLLLRACASLERVTLALAGDGPQQAALRRLARRLDARVLFLGPLQGAQKQAWLQAADLLALPSRVLPDGRTESAPVVLLEAMARALPVVATAVGGNAELIRDGQNGLLVPPNQATLLRAAVARLRDDPALRRQLGQAGQRTAEDHTWDRVGARLTALLAEL